MLSLVVLADPELEPLHRGDEPFGRQRAVIEQALAEAELDISAAEWVVLPHFGRRRLEAGYFREFGIEPARTAWEWSRTVGHLGAGDQFAGLDHLVGSGRTRPADRCVLVGVGAGYSWGCAVLEILERPPWITGCPAYHPPRRPGRPAARGLDPEVGAGGWLITPRE